MKVTKTIEMEGGCHANEYMSEAYQDLKSEFETVGLKEGVDFSINKDGRYQGHDAPSMQVLRENQDEYYVFYLFEVKMNERAEQEGKRQGWFD
jgi:hypothetical protein